MQPSNTHRQHHLAQQDLQNSQVKTARSNTQPMNRRHVCFAEATALHAHDGQLDQQRIETAKECMPNTTANKQTWQGVQHEVKPQLLL
jgi:hypothetical protein